MIEKIGLEYNPATKRYDLYIDGKKEGDGTFREMAELADRLRFQNEDSES